MNYRMIIRLLALILRIVAVLMVPALVISAALNEREAAVAFGVTIALMLLLSFLPRFFGPRKHSMYAREGFVVVSLAWYCLVSGRPALLFQRLHPTLSTACSRRFPGSPPPARAS